MTLEEKLGSIDEKEIERINQELLNLPKRQLSAQERKAQAISWAMSCMKDQSKKGRRFVETEFEKIYG